MRIEITMCDTLKKTILEQLSSAENVLLMTHLRPDGDALGSQVGLKALLRENFPDKQVFMVGDEAGYYSFMEGTVMDEVNIFFLSPSSASSVKRKRASHIPTDASGIKRLAVCEIRSATPNSSAESIAV